MTLNQLPEPTRSYMKATMEYRGVQEVDTNHALISIKARGYQAVDFFGERQVHDFSGMSVPERIVLERDHCREKILGYADNIRLTEYGLEMDGHLFRDLPAAVELWPVLKNGVPQQASVTFTPELVEGVPARERVEVNGKMEEGPITVFRRWKLESVAVCSYGVDDTTHVTPVKMSTQDAGNGGKGEKMSLFGRKRFSEEPEPQEEPKKQEQSEGGEDSSTDEKDAKIASLQEQIAELVARINTLEAGGGQSPVPVENSEPKEDETKKEFARLRDKLDHVEDVVQRMYAATRMGHDPLEGIEKKEYADDRAYLVALESAKLAGNRRS